MTVLRDTAPAKINLCLFLGPTRPSDGRHELVSVMQSLTLADELTLSEAPDATSDEVICPGVEGPNLAGQALAAYREATGWDGAPWRLEIVKRVPVAAGMGGGSADAAAALRLACRAAGRDPAAEHGLLLELAAALGADVPAQVRPGRALATGAGERVEELPAGPPFGVLVLPGERPLSTAAVYRECDRLGLPRADLAAPLADVRGALDDGGALPLGLAVNDLEPAARSLEPAIDGALAEARDAGADHVMVSGSGPTVLGLFLGVDGEARAQAAAEKLAGRRPAPLVAGPLPDAASAGFATMARG